MSDTNHSTRPKTIPTLLPALIVGLTTLTACSDLEPDASLEPAEFRELEDGLLLHWTFEDNIGLQITDVSGNGRHGMLQGPGPSLVASPNGQAVNLDGVDDWISLTGPRAPALYGGADGSFTLSARLKVSDVSKYNTFCVGCGPFSTLYAGTEAYGPALLSALDDQTSTAWKWLTSSPTLANNTWTEVTLVVENGSNARYYIDCSLDAQLDNPNLGLIDVGSSSIGKSTIANRWFGGQIDEFRVWDRALEDAELAQLCPVVETDPLAEDLEMHWTFEDRSGNQITDISGKGLAGTAVGGSFVASPKGEALSLDGIDDKVTFIGPRALALYGGAQGDFTFSATVRVPNVVKYNTLCIGCGPFSTMYIGDPAPGARVLSGLWNSDTQTALWTASSPTLTNDEWTEVTLVVEGGVAARTYENCNLDSTLPNANVALRDSGYSALGQGSIPGRWFQGEVDELRVWSRALSEQDIALICAGRTELCDGAPVYVDVDAPDGGDGLTWASAFNDLQAAIDAAAECTSPQLWVAEGQYAPAPSTQQVANIRHDVEIYGGFAGDEILLAQRDVAAHPVRLGADGWQTYVVEIEDENSGPDGYASVRLDGVTISGSAGGSIHVDANAFGDREVVLENLTVTDNTPNLTSLFASAGNITLTVRNSSFERNQGGAIFNRWATLVIEDTSFIENTSIHGGAIYLLDPLYGPVSITDSVFRDNSAAWGGAIFIDDNEFNPLYVELTIQGGEFDGNVATGGGGAIYAEESTCNFDSVVFTDNTAKFGGAIHLANASPADNDELVISSCRFIGNQAIDGNGGALRLQEAGTTVINSEFAANQASTIGGAVYGRGDFIGSTFANNVAGSGAALYAPAGADMNLHHCVVYPDTIFGTNIHGGYSCTKSVSLLDAPQTLLTNVTPFASADLDLDGLTEWYLNPDGPCTGLANGVIDEFEWTSLTVEQSQCTDAGWPEPGVHYPPQTAVGACE